MAAGFTVSPKPLTPKQRAARRLAELKATHGTCQRCGNIRISANTIWFEGGMYCRICVAAGTITMTSQRQVYFITDGIGHVKIGYAVNPDYRLIELQCGNALPLTLLASFKGSSDTEKALHERFAAHRVRGEWFRLAPEITEFITSLPKPKPRPRPKAALEPSPSPEPKLRHIPPYVRAQQEAAARQATA